MNERAEAGLCSSCCVGSCHESNLGEAPPKEDATADLEIESTCGTIIGKFLAANLNIQAEQSREHAKARVVHVENPKASNESDIAFSGLKAGGPLNYEQLSHIDSHHRDKVAEFLQGCSSSSSSSSSLRDSWSVGFRLEGNLGARRCAANAARPSDQGCQGAGIESPKTPSVSSFRPTSKHSALVELCWEYCICLESIPV